MNEWLFRKFPNVWGRWWAARLMATTACSDWLHEGNPDFTRWQRFKRNALGLGVFLVPVKLPLTITQTSSQEQSDSTKENVI